MAGRGGIGLDTRPLVRDPGFVDPFADPSGSSSPQPNASLQGDAETLITQRSLGFAVTAGYSLPKLALVGAQTFAAAHAVAWVRRGDRHDDSATIVTVAAFGSVVGTADLPGFDRASLSGSVCWPTASSGSHTRHFFRPFTWMMNTSS